MTNVFTVFLLLIMSFRILPQSLEGIPKNFTANDGLSNSYISGITQDNAGFIWIATNDGLNRFDGKNFTSFFHSQHNPHSISSNKLFGMQKDIIGNIWVGNLNKTAVDVIDPKTLQVKRIPVEPMDKPQEIEFNFLFSASQGNIYLNYWHSSYLIKVDIRTYEIDQIRLPLETSGNKKEKIHFITEVPSTDLLVTTTFGRVFRIDAKNDQVSLIHSFGAVAKPSRSLTSKPTEVFVITALAEAWRFDARKLVFIKIADKDNYIARIRADKLNSFYADSSANLWLIDQFGQFSFVPGNNGKPDFSRLRQRDIINAGLRSFFIDDEKNAWLGSTGYGLFLLSDNYKYFSNFSHDRFYPDADGVRSLRFITRKQNKTYISGYDGLAILDENFSLQNVIFPRVPKRSGLFSSWGGKNIIWLGSETETNSVDWYDINSGKTGILSFPELREGHHTFYDIWEENEFLWFSISRTIVRYNRKTSETLYIPVRSTEQTGPLSGDVTLVRKINGKYVAAVINHGLYEIAHETGRLRPFSFSGYDGPDISKELISSLITDSNGDQWIGTRGYGLFQIDNAGKKIIHYSTQNGLPNNTIYSVLNDKQGNIWGATNFGIFRLNPADKTIRIFNKSDGLVDNEFNTGASFIDSDGTLFFGGISGFSSFKPEQIRTNTIPPRIGLVKLSVNNTDYTSRFFSSANRQIMLPHDSNYINISFASLSYSSRNSIRYAYKIEEIHSEFISLDDNDILQLNGLDNGTYTISITGTNGDGVWALNPLKLTIIIKPPFTESWVFYFLIFTGFVVTAFIWAERREKLLTRQKAELEAAVKERTLELENQNREIAGLNDELQTALTIKNKFLSIVAHDLKSPFTALLGYTEILSDDLESLPKEQVSKMINELGRLSRQTYSLLLNLLHWTQIQTNRISLNPVIIHLKKSVEHSYSIMESSIKNKQIELLNLIPEDIQTRADQNMINTIMQNLVNNAYKFTNPGGKIIISTETKEQKIYVSVEDSGVGMTSEKIKTIFSEEKNRSASGTLGEKGTGLGMLLIRELLDFSGQQIFVASEPGKGTKITFTLDLYEKEMN